MEVGWEGELLVLDHLAGLAEELDVPAPECRPGLFPLLEAEDEELGRPEEGPGAVGEVAIPTD